MLVLGGKHRKGKLQNREVKKNKDKKEGEEKLNSRRKKKLENPFIPSLIIWIIIPCCFKKCLVFNISFNSSNEMKAHANKCHTFFVVSFNQLSLCMSCLHKCFILDKLCNNFQKLWCFSLWPAHGAKSPKKQSSQNCFQQENHSFPDLKES